MITHPKFQKLDFTAPLMVLSPALNQYDESEWVPCVVSEKEENVVIYKDAWNRIMRYEINDYAYLRNGPATIDLNWITDRYNDDLRDTEKKQQARLLNRDIILKEYEDMKQALKGL